LKNWFTLEPIKFVTVFVTVPRNPSFRLLGSDGEEVEDPEWLLEETWGLGGDAELLSE
jgi:hypothetical protein